MPIARRSRAAALAAAVLALAAVAGEEVFAQAQGQQAQGQQGQAQQGQRRPQGQQQQQASLPSRIPPPGPAEVPLFPARDYTDPRTGLTLTVPAGWLVIEVPQIPEGEISRLFMEGPGLPAPNCSIVVVRPQQPPRATQAQLNRVIHDDRSVQTVRQQLGQQGRRVVNVRKLTQTGVAGLNAQVTIPGGPWAPEMTTYVSFFEQVGRRFSINCNVLSLDMDAMRPDVDAIIRSFRFQQT